MQITAEKCIPNNVLTSQSSYPPNDLTHYDTRSTFFRATSKPSINHHHAEFALHAQICYYTNRIFFACSPLSLSFPQSKITMLISAFQTPFKTACAAGQFKERRRNYIWTKRTLYHFHLTLTASWRGVGVGKKREGLKRDFWRCCWTGIILHNVIMTSCLFCKPVDHLQCDMTFIFMPFYRQLPSLSLFFTLSRE